MATSPAPDAAAPPGMCPGIAVLGGGGGSGDGDGSGDGGSDGSGGDGKGSGDGETGDGKSAQGAPDYEKYPECGYASHPVDVVTGRAFTHPVTDLELPGPLPLQFRRMYSSKMAARDVGLGYGWSHTFGWEIEIRRRQITVWNEQGIAVDFPMIAAEGEVMGPWGWLLRRDGTGFALDVDDGVWRLFSTADECGKRYRLTAIVDRNRNRIALNYKNERLVEVVDSAGRVIRVSSTHDGRIASLAVKNSIMQGKWVVFASYTYDHRGNLAAVQDADGFSASYEYDEEHQLTADTDRAGLTFHFAYDREGRCVESWGDYLGKRDPSLCDELPKRLADGETQAKGIHHCRFDYMPGRYSEVADSTQVRRFFGNKHGTLDKSVTGGAVTTAEYNDQGRLVARTDPMGATTSFTLDARGRIVKIEEPLGRVTQIERDALGLPISVTDPAGEVATILRDRNGNVLSITDGSMATIAYRYDPRGLVTEVHHPNGGRTMNVYDAYGNLIQVTYPNGAVHRFAYDAFGRLVAEVEADGAESRYAYSNRGDLLATYDALGSAIRFSFDGESRLTEIFSAEGRATRLVWGGYNKLSAIQESDGSWTYFLHDREGQLVEVRNQRGERHRCHYDLCGRLIGEQTFDGRTQRYHHDLAGRVVRIEDDRRQPIAYVYNPAGELVERHLPDGEVETFQYNACGELVAAVSRGGEVRFERDAVGRPVREIQTVVDEAHEIESTYDAMSERVRRRTSLGHLLEIERDVTGAPVRSLLDGSYEVRHQNDIFGRETRRQLPRGGTVETVFDILGRIQQRRVLRAGVHLPLGADQPDWIGERFQAPTADRSYGFDRDHWLVQTWDHRTGSTVYEYDAANRLLGVRPERSSAELFHYDPAGCVHEAGAGAPPRVYGPGGRLQRRGNTEYLWDASGRLTERRDRGADRVDRVTRFFWDGAGRLDRVESPDGTHIEFTYDALSRRLQKRVSRPPAPGARPVLFSLTRFVWDGDTLVHAICKCIYPDPVVEERTYVFDDDQLSPRAHRDMRRGDGAAAATWFEYIDDPLGTPERLVDAAGELACEIERTAWGQLRPVGDAVTTTPLRLAGQYEDEETGLAYNRFRYYDPNLGLFISADPLGLVGNLNAYAYAPNAFTWIDPLGLINLTPAAKARLAGLPSTPGVYHIESNGKVYTGSALNLKDRLCGPKAHKKAEKLLNDPNAKITIQTVDTGSGKTTKTKSRGVKVIEAETMRANGNVPQSAARKGGTTTNSENSIPALTPEKEKKYRKAYKPSITGTTSY